MKNRGVTVGALICAMCGVAGLFTAAHVTHPAPCSVSSAQPGLYSACEGIVWETFQNKEHTFVTLFDDSPISVPLFNFTGTISVGDLLQVEGTVSLYNGDLEIIPKEYSISKVLYGRCVDSVLYTEQGTFSAQLSDGDYALIGTIKDGQLSIERKLEIPLVSLEGRISNVSTGNSPSTFFLYADPRIFVSSLPLSFGIIKGFGIQNGQEVIVLYHTWEELAADSIGQARKMPEGYPVAVSGIIRSVTTSKGHIFIVVEDSTGSILVPIFSDMQPQLEVDSTTFREGQSLTVTGTIHVYTGTVELLPVVIHA
jgi:DNA/RNA endonuclease YhcR with UshA esterase domain